MGETTTTTMLPMLHSDLVPEEIICNKKRIFLAPLQFLLEGVALKVHGSRQNIKHFNTLFILVLALVGFRSVGVVGVVHHHGPEVSCSALSSKVSG